MASRRNRRLFRILVLLVLLIFGGYFGMGWLGRTVLDRSERIVAQLGGPGSRIRIGHVDFQLMAGDIRWNDVLIAQPEDDPDTTADPRPMRLSGRVDEIAVHGLSLWRLLFAHTLSMRSIRVIRPDIELILMNDSIEQERPRDYVDISSLNADSLVVEGASFLMRRTGDSAEYSFDTLDLSVIGLRSGWRTGQPLDVHFGAATGQVRGVHASLPPLQDLRVAGIDLAHDGHLLRVTDLNVTPLRGPQEYGALIREETDLFDVHLDTALVDGMDLMALINARSLTTTAIRFAGADLNIYRDKTLPDNVFKHKALPARLLRELSFGLCTDSLVVDRWKVHYHEKDTLSPDYGEVLFTEIHAVVKGLCTADTLQTDTVVVMATAMGYDQAHVDLQVRTVIADRSDRFTVNARIAGLPFGVFNRMTSDLMLARATAGTIGGVDLTMTADDRRATGRVDMEYDGLALELLKQDGSGDRRKFMSGLMNQMVHSRNLRSTPDFRHGDFTFERRRDRSIFNYLWSGLREGMIATVLPGVLDDARKLDKPGPRKK